MCVKAIIFFLFFLVNIQTNWNKMQTHCFLFNKYFVNSWESHISYIKNKILLFAIHCLGLVLIFLEYVWECVFSVNLCILHGTNRARMDNGISAKRRIRIDDDASSCQRVCIPYRIAYRLFRRFCRRLPIGCRRTWRTLHLKREIGNVEILVNVIDSKSQKMGKEQ